MEKKKEDIETRLRQIQKLLKDNTVSDDIPIEPPKHTKKMQLIATSNLPTAAENRPIQATIHNKHQQNSIREQLREIKSLLMTTIDGQRRIEKELIDIKRHIAESVCGNFHSGTDRDSHIVVNSQNTYRTKISALEEEIAEHSQSREQSELSIFNNFRSQANRYY